MTPIKVALAGVGLAGQVFHAPLILALPELFQLRTVIERNPKSKRGTIGDKFNVETKLVSRLEEALGDPEVELVVIGTPSHTHFEMAKAALKAGKHVLVDKPVTTNYEEALELNELAKSQNRILTGFQNRRWDADYLTLQKLIKEGALGDIVDFESHYDRYSPSKKGTWKDDRLPGNGIVFDLGAHLIDQALQLFGRPSKVTAFTDHVRGLGDGALDDRFTITFHYSTKPVQVILKGTLLSVRSKQIRYIVRGNKGTFTKYGVDPQEDQIKAGMKIGDPKLGVDPEELHGVLEVLGSDGAVQSKNISSLQGDYLSLYRNVADAIRSASELNVKWIEAAQVIEMIGLAYKSASQRSTVEVPPLVAH